jgi:hypothetical protein
MCMRVQSAATVTRVYDAKTRTITVPAGLGPALTLRAVRAVVAELHLPVEGGAPLCWCGAPLTLTGLIPEQRRGEDTPGAA